jgi:hypothetical protein
MKYLLTLFLSVPFYSYSQTQIQESKTNIQIGNKNGYELIADQKRTEGLTYVGSGEYLITEVGGSGFVSLSTLRKRALEKIEKFATNSNDTFKILNIQDFKMTVGVLPRVKINFLLYNKDGILKITKEEAKKVLFELNDLLKSGLIKQDEFDKKAAELKKILLSN